jgi:hypothetical protein
MPFSDIPSGLPPFDPSRDPTAPEGMSFDAMLPEMPPMETFSTVDSQLPLPGFEDFALPPRLFPSPDAAPLPPELAYALPPLNPAALDARGTVEDPNYSNLFIHQRLGNEPLPTEVHEFGDEPWRAADYLGRRLSPTLPDDLMAGLSAWNAAPNKQLWAKQNPDLAAKITRAVSAETQPRLRSNQDVIRNTRMHLEEFRQREEVSWVERMFKGTKEFIWNDFGDHPVMSAGAVIAGIMVYRMLSGTRAGKFVAWGAALSIGYHLLRDKFNFKPGEKLAQTVGLLSPKGEQGVRGFLDTMRRPFVGPEGEGSAVAYYYEKLGIRDEAERTMFVALLQENPKAFFAWYNGTAGGGGSFSALPEGVRRALNRNSRVTSYLSDMTNAEKTKMLTRVADKMFAYIGRQNPEASYDPTGYIYRKYVAEGDANYFNGLHGDFEVSCLEAMNEPGRTPQMRADCDRMLTEAAAFNRANQLQIRGGSDVITFLDILLAEESAEGWAELSTYNGLGLDFQESRALVTDYAGRGIGMIDRGGHAVLDWMTGKDRSGGKLTPTQVKNSLPWFWDQGSKLFWKGMDKVGLQKHDFTDWQKSDFAKWYRAGMAAGGATLDALAKTPVGELFIASSDLLMEALKNGYTMTGDGIEAVADYVEKIAERLREQGGKVPVDEDGVSDSTVTPEQDRIPSPLGTPGSDRLPGSPGTTGSDRLPGTPGSRGTDRDPGFSGASGADRATGSSDVPGSDRLPGSPGTTGSDRLPGTPGSRGTDRDPGFSGASGADRDPGYTGTRPLDRRGPSISGPPSLDDPDRRPSAADFPPPPADRRPSSADLPPPPSQ